MLSPTSFRVSRDDGVNEPTNTPTETPDDGNDEKPEDNTPEDKTQLIKFIDNTVKTLCVVSWDTNGDAELSYGEAAAVTDIGTTFKSYDIISFTELACFTGLSYIANEAFRDCGSLKKIELPHNITSIGNSAFRDCSSLTSVTIGNGVTSIGDSAFMFCDSLKSVTIGNSVTSIGKLAFAGCSSLTSVTIPDSVTTIGNYAFYDCNSLKSVTIGNSVTSIGQEAFLHCSLLESFYGKFASEDNRCLIVDGKLIAFAPAGLTEYTIPDSVTSIGSGAFYCCDSLTSVTIPDSVTSIGKWAFYDCNKLTSVYCKATTPPAGDYYMFKSNASERKIYVPAASVEAYKSAARWSDYKDYIVGYEF